MKNFVPVRNKLSLVTPDFVTKYKVMKFIFARGRMNRNIPRNLFGPADSQ